MNIIELKSRITTLKWDQKMNQLHPYRLKELEELEKELNQINEKKRVINEKEKQIICELRDKNIADIREGKNKNLELIKEFYHITSFENLHSILNQGICPKNELNDKKIIYSDNSYGSVQERRNKLIKLSDNYIKLGHDLVPLYLFSKNPSIYRFQENIKNKKENECLLIISKNIIFDKDIQFAFIDGNFASNGTIPTLDFNDLNIIDFEKIRESIKNKNGFLKREQCAELLIWPKINPKYIEKIIVKNDEIRKKVIEVVQNIFGTVSIQVSLDSKNNYLY